MIILTKGDPELWKLACNKVWGMASSSLVTHYNGNWRTMFVEKPRLNFNGAYISRTTYIRQGEPSFQDHGYRQSYLVEYFRYLRFYPDGNTYPKTLYIRRIIHFSKISTFSSDKTHLMCEVLE